MMPVDFALLIEREARGSRDFHRFLHHRLRQPPAVVLDNAGNPTVAPDLLGEAVVLIEALRQLWRQADAATRTAWAATLPAASATRSLIEHCAAVALALESGRRGGWIRRREPSDDQIVARFNRLVTGSGAPRLRRTAREEMHWHKALAAQWFSGALDVACDLCAPTEPAGWRLEGLSGHWR
jgi:hypothetical protein